MVNIQSCPTCHSRDVDAVHDMTGQYLLCRNCGHFEDIVPRTTHRASEYRPFFTRHQRVPIRGLRTTKAA
jgi:hypothetical protein